VDPRYSQLLMSALLPFHRPVMDSMMDMTLGGLFNRFAKREAVHPAGGSASRSCTTRDA
jgi:hypothetical protein